MDEYKQHLARTLAETGALFFDSQLVLKDGRPTPYFVNTAVFKTGRLGLEIGSYFARMMVSRGLLNDVDIILGPSYKGSAIALATTVALWSEHGRELLFEYDRKEPKAHGEGSSRRRLFVNGALFDGCRILVVDDVATTMNTKYELLEKIKLAAREMEIRTSVKGVVIGIDREQTTAVHDEEGRLVLNRKGENAIHKFVTSTGISVYAVAGIREIVDYLYKEKIPVRIRGTWSPIDEKTKFSFDRYLQTYGVD